MLTCLRAVFVLSIINYTATVTIVIVGTSVTLSSVFDLCLWSCRRSLSHRWCLVVYFGDIDKIKSISCQLLFMCSFIWTIRVLTYAHTIFLSWGRLMHWTLRRVTTNPNLNVVVYPRNKETLKHVSYVHTENLAIQKFRLVTSDQWVTHHREIGLIILPLSICPLSLTMYAFSSDLLTGTLAFYIKD